MASVSSQQTAEIDPSWSRRALWISLSCVVVFAIYFPGYAQLAEVWWTAAAYNHCLLIIPIAAYFAWEKRAQVLRLNPAVSWLAVVFLAFNALLWLAGKLFIVMFFQHLALVGMMIAVLWTLIGNQVARVIWFPLLYLYFLVPEGEFLVPYLQDWTAIVVVALLRATGIPVLHEGLFLAIPSGNFEVARACSGINYLIATLAVGTMFAYSQYQSNWRRVAFMALAVAVPLVANGIRAYGIVIIAHYSDYKYATGIDHFIYGWLFFGVVVFVLFAVGQIFAEARRPAPDSPTAGSGTPTSANPIGIVALLIGVIALAPVVLEGKRAAFSTDDHNFDVTADGWRIDEQSELRLGGEFPGATAYAERNFVNESQDWITFVTALFVEQRQGAELVSPDNLLYSRQKWRSIDGRSIVATGLTQPSIVREIRLRARNGQEYLVWTWYEIGDATTATGWDAKIKDVWAQLAGDYRGSVLAVLGVEVTGSPEQARQMMREFCNDSLCGHLLRR
ncbi:MAG: exosortase A [Pseudomonadota bacterium]